MKKIIIIACALLLLPLGLKAQNWRSCLPNATIIDTITSQVPRYLYHDDPWYDSPSLNPSYVLGTAVNIVGHCPTLVAHIFHTDAPLEVIGIAGAPIAEYAGYGPNCITLDTTIEGRLPEFFQLYEATSDTFILVDEVRWDTCSQIRRLFAGEGTSRFGYDVCEAYFAKPVTVEDSFYVGFTTNNNMIYRNQRVEIDLGEGYVMYEYYNIWEHLITMIGAVRCSDGVNPVNTSVKYKPSQVYAIEDSVIIRDTIWYQEEHPNEWWFLWPIFDTTGMACQSVSQLAVTPIENQSTTLTWSAPSGQALWDVEYGHSDAPRSSYTQTRVRPSPYLNLSNLDTGTYYTVYVRTVCDSNEYSAWSDSLVFYVPGDSSNVGIRAVEQYTNLFPNPASDQATVTSSFGVKGIEVYSLKGELMEHSSRDGATVANIDLQRYPAGSYIVRIRTPKGIVARRLEVVR